MTTPNQILADLLISDATADAIGEHLHIPMLVAKALCERHEIDGLVIPRKIAKGNLIAWQLTAAGIEVANSLETPALTYA